MPKSGDSFILSLLKKISENTSIDILSEIQEILDLIINLIKEKSIKDRRQFENMAVSIINVISKLNINVKETTQRDFLIKCLQLLFELGTPSRNTICEWMFWYIEGTEVIR